MSSERRPPGAAELAGYLIGLAQAASALTLAVLAIHDIGGSADAPGVNSGLGLAAIGVMFGILGVVVGLCALLCLRGSVPARFALVGAEIVLAAVSYAMIPTVGVVISATAVMVILLTTALSSLGRPRAA